MSQNTQKSSSQHLLWKEALGRRAWKTSESEPQWVLISAERAGTITNCRTCNKSENVALLDWSVLNISSKILEGSNEKNHRPTRYGLLQETPLYLQSAGSSVHSCGMQCFSCYHRLNVLPQWLYVCAIQVTNCSPDNSFIQKERSAFAFDFLYTETVVLVLDTTSYSRNLWWTFYKLLRLKDDMHYILKKILVDHSGSSFNGDVTLS